MRKGCELRNKLRNESADFLKELTKLLNRHGVDAACNVRDFLLAEYVLVSLRNFAETIEAEKYHSAS